MSSKLHYFSVFRSLSISITHSACVFFSVSPHLSPAFLYVSCSLPLFFSIFTLSLSFSYYSSIFFLSLSSSHFLYIILSFNSSILKSSHLSLYLSLSLSACLCLPLSIYFFLFPTIVLALDVSLPFSRPIILSRTAHSLSTSHF